MEYLARPDAGFAWKIVKEAPMPGGASTIEVELTSQTWQNITWKHHLGIVRPPKMGSHIVPLLFIWGDYDSGQALLYLAQMVQKLDAPIAMLYDIPNQPLFGDLGEDGLISYTFVKYLETRDKTWPLLFPMTKGAIRAMDAIQELARKEWKAEATGFVVTGASKRGWTTWLVGAADPRVRGIAPMVYDNLNLPAQMKHQIDTWGRYSEQISDYTEKGLPEMLQSEKGKELGAMVDPYTFRSRIRIPKLIINGTNDRYWTLDSTNLYFDQLSGPRYILYDPNSGHGLEDRERVLGTLAAFHAFCAGKTAFPRLSWKYRPVKEGVELSIQSDPKPAEVAVWVASAATKDFRDARWEKKAASLKNGSYLFTLTTPKKGYAALFGEARYTRGGQGFHLSTQVQIIGGAK